MEGMVYTLVEEPRNREVDVAATARLVDSVYRFRGLGDPKVYIDANTAGLLTNYSATNFRLAAWAQDSLQKILPRLATATGADKTALEARRDEMVGFAEKYLKLNARILPNEWRVHYYAGQLYQQVGRTAASDSAYLAGMALAGPNARVFAMNLAQSYMRQARGGEAASVLEQMVARFPEDLELAFGLSEIRQHIGDAAGARKALSEWLARNPKHEYATAVGQQLQRMDTAPAPAAE
jgi:Flp pilus assembly protein TadD